MFILVLFNFFSINTLIDCTVFKIQIQFSLLLLRAMLKTIRENYLDRSSFHLKCHQNNTHTPLLIKATTRFIFCFVTWGTNHFLDLPRCKILISKQIFGPFKTQKFMTKRLLYLLKKPLWRWEIQIVLLNMTAHFKTKRITVIKPNLIVISSHTRFPATHKSFD